MSVRTTPLALALALALPATAFAQGFEYTPSTGQYRIASTTKSVQEMMGQKQEGESSIKQLVTLTIARPNKDTLSLTAVLDSVSAQGMTPPGLDKMLGLKVSAKLSPFGAFYSAEGPPDSSMMGSGQMVEGLSNILPRIRGKLAAGSTWTDTVSAKSKQNAFDLDRRVISKFTVVGDTTVAGEKSWKVVRESNATLSGSGAPQGQPATMDGSVTSKSTIVVNPKGVFVGSNSEDQANIKVVFAANGMEIGITQNAVTKIEKVK